MSMFNHNNIKNMKNQDSMSPSEISNPVVMFPEKSILDKAQDSDFKNIINMFKELKEDMNKKNWMRTIKKQMNS